MAGPVETTRLTLVPATADQARAQVERMPAEAKAQLSAAWLELLDAPAPDFWTLGFDMVDRATGVVVGACGFKGPPGADGTVEIAYSVRKSHQGQGYATEATGALVALAFDTGRVQTVLAHTLPEANASTRVLTKCGFRHVGEVTDPDDGLVWRWEIVRVRP